MRSRQRALADEDDDEKSQKKRADDKCDMKINEDSGHINFFSDLRTGVR